MESVYVMTLEVIYENPQENDHKGWHMIDTVFEALEDCRKYIGKEFDENTGFEEVSEGHYEYKFALDRSLVVYRENNMKEEWAKEGDKMTIMVDKVEFIRKEKV